MILKILMALFSPEFERVLIEIWDAQKKYKSDKTSVAIDQAIENAEKNQDTEDLSKELGKLIK